MTIRGRVTAMVCLFSLGILLVSAVALYWSDRRALRMDARSAREKMADQFARTCRNALLVGDDLAALNAADFLGKQAGVMNAYVLDAGGKVVAHSAKGQLGMLEVPPAPDAWRLTRAFSLKATQGMAVVDFSRSAMERNIADSLRPAAHRIIWVTLGGLILGFLGAGLLAGTITRPILRIARGTKMIAQGRLDHKIEPLGTDELAELAEDFNRMAVRLGELDRMKNDFVANVTHELRSPISAIGTGLRLVADEVSAGDLAEVTDQLAAMRNNAVRLERFVNDLLDLSAIEAKRTDLARESLSVRASAEEVVTLFRAKAFEKSVALGLGDIPKDLEVWADPDKLSQILTNLVGNALKFTPAGGRVAIGAERNGKEQRIFVKDTGPGIRPEDQARIFDRFEQVRQASNGVEGPKGTGLGLAIARGLAEAHGGRLTVESVWGKGSVFSLWLPVEANHE